MKPFSKTLFSIPAALLVNSLYVTNATAVDFFADAGISFKQLEFSAQSSNGLTDYTLTPLFTMLSVSAGMVANRFYATANLENSLFDVELQDAVNEGDVDTLSREDRTITVGYFITDNLSIFGGYLTGDTKDDYSFPLQNNETGKISFSEEGPFVGGNYSFLFTKGALSLNFAYAFLNGEYEQTYRNDLGSGEEKYKGDTTGVSMGVKWVGKWTDHLNYYAGGKVNLFKFDSDEFDTEENFYIAQAGLTYKF